MPYTAQLRGLCAGPSPRYTTAETRARDSRLARAGPLVGREETILKQATCPLLAGIADGTRACHRSFLSAIGGVAIDHHSAAYGQLPRVNSETIRNGTEGYCLGTDCLF